MLAVVSVVLAVAGHALGGAALPSSGAMLSALCFAVPACWLFASRQRRTLGVTLTSAGVQLTAHGVFVLDGCHVPAHDGATVRMLAAHGTITFVAARALARLDAVIWLFYRYLVHHLTGWNVSFVSTPDDAVPVPVVAAGTSHLDDRHSCALKRRGPPLFAAA